MIGRVCKLCRSTACLESTSSTVCAKPQARLSSTASTRQQSSASKLPARNWGPASTPAPDFPSLASRPRTQTPAFPTLSVRPRAPLAYGSRDPSALPSRDWVARPQYGRNESRGTDFNPRRNDNGQQAWGPQRDRPDRPQRDKAPPPSGFGLKGSGRSEPGLHRNFQNNPDPSNPNRDVEKPSVEPSRAFAAPPVTPGFAFEPDEPVDALGGDDERTGEGGQRFAEKRGKTHMSHRQERTTPKIRLKNPLKVPKLDITRDRGPKKLKAHEIKVDTEKQVIIPSTVTVSRLAVIFGVKLFNLQVRMSRLEMDENQRQPDYTLSAEDACNLALEFGLDPLVDDQQSFDLTPLLETAESMEYPQRPPVVTIMGHVDHGKTTLLDSLRDTAVAAGEAGGITQHIGAFSVQLSSLLKGQQAATGSTITFLDTPGHAAFTAMRARGASVTDIIVLVVAADDGVMPQTKEVIKLWRNEGDKVALVVAINKMDKPGVDLDKVKSALGAEDIHLEEDGGDIPCVKVSGLAKLGLGDLVEMLSTIAEVRELRARAEGQAEGFVIESNVHRGWGDVATALVTRGTLQIGSIIVAGQALCRVRAMRDHTGQPIEEAGPGTPVVISGWRELPEAGDQMIEAVNGEDEAKRAISNRIREAERKRLLVDADAINIKRRDEKAQLLFEKEHLAEIKRTGGNVYEAKLELAKKVAVAAESGFKELRLLIKGDVSGTVEAVVGALQPIGNKEAGVKVVYSGVGEITTGDVDFAEATGSLIIGFNVPCARSVQAEAEASKVPLHLESVIYRLIETVREKTAALLVADIKYRTIAEATVQQIFEINLKRNQKAKVAGSKVSNGILKKGDLVRVLRGDERAVVFEGRMDTLKHLKKDVQEIRKGMECGIGFEGFSDLQAGDEIMTVEKYRVARTL